MLVFHQSLRLNTPLPDGLGWQLAEATPGRHPKVPSNFESTGGAQPIPAGQVKPMVAGPPLAPILQLCPALSQPIPGQSRTPASSLSGMSYSMNCPCAGSRWRFGAFSVPPPLPVWYWIHIGCVQPLMIFSRLVVQVAQPPGAPVGV